MYEPYHKSNFFILERNDGGVGWGVKCTYKLAKIEERKIKVLDHIICIKDENQQVWTSTCLSVKEEEVEDGLWMYFRDLLNMECVSEV